MWDRFTQTSFNANAVVNLDMVKSHVSEYSDDYDDLITSYISAATALIDGPRGIGVALLTNTFKYTLDWFLPEIIIPLTPVQSVQSIEYRDTTNTWNTVDPTIYYVDTDCSLARITLNYARLWPPTVRPVGSSVRVNFTAGFGDDATSVPFDLQQALLLIIGSWYQNREGVVGVGSRDSPAELPIGVEAVLSKYRALLMV